MMNLLHDAGLFHPGEHRIEYIFDLSRPTESAKLFLRAASRTGEIDLERRNRMHLATVFYFAGSGKIANRLQQFVADVWQSFCNHNSFQFSEGVLELLSGHIWITLYFHMGLLQSQRQRVGADDWDDAKSLHSDFRTRASNQNTPGAKTRKDFVIR